MIQKKSICMMLVTILFLKATQSKYDIELITEDPKPQKVLVFADFNFSNILIQSQMFDCNQHDSCEWYNQEMQIGEYMGSKYTYQEAFIKFKFEKIATKGSKNINFQDVRISVRITDSFNVLGLNDKTPLSSFLDDGTEFVLDLKKKTLKLQDMSSDKCRKIRRGWLRFF